MELLLSPPPSELLKLFFLESLRLEKLHEGKSVQILHVGDYTEIGAVCEKLYTDYLPENNLKPNGYYHEIYLNDPTRTAPQKRKIVIRQPVMPLSTERARMG
jgi:hypothetical protein